MTICSLLPAATEIAFALGLGDDVVGVTHECDFPPAARSRPRIVSSRVAVDALSSAAIDARVRETLQTGESLYDLDVETMRNLRPDLILTQDLCHVCAIDPGGLLGQLNALPFRPRMLALHAHTLAELFEEIQLIGDATCRGEIGRAHV